MANLISFPFRIAPTGYVVTRDEDDPAYYAELIALLVATRAGEREQVPSFGVLDPTYSHLDAQELAYKVDAFGPPVRIVTISEEFISATELAVKVEFTVLEAEDESLNTDDL